MGLLPEKTLFYIAEEKACRKLIFRQASHKILLFENIFYFKGRISIQ